MTSSIGRGWRPDIPVAPGETIREVLEERGIPQTDFAVRLGRSEKFVSQLVNGKAPLTHETAIELERVLSIEAAFWNAAEAAYRDLLARQEANAELAGHEEWAASFPLKEMEAQGLITRERSPTEQTEELLRYFGVSSIEAYRRYWGSERRLDTRMSTAYTSETPAIAVWLRAGEIAAEQIATGPFDAEQFRSALRELREVSRLKPEEWGTRLRKLCAQAGVAVVLVPDLPKAPCYAVSWWATRARAVIQLGLRRKTDDQFWFSFYHEAGHVLLDDRRRSGITDLNGNSAAEARVDRFAADLLIPPDDYQRLLSAGKPTKASVRAFADEIGIAPGIVAGRLQKDGVIPFSRFNDLKVKLEWG